MTGPFEGVDRYVGPGAYSEEEEAFAGVPLTANIRNATFIGKGKSILTVDNQQVSRLFNTMSDSLNRGEVLNVTLVGDNVGVDDYQQLIEFYQKTNIVGVGDLITNLEVTRGTQSLIQESYEFEVVVVGGSGAGKYRVKTLSTGALTAVLTCDSVFGDDTLISGIVFRVTDTLGTSVGDKVRLDIRTDYRDGDFSLDNTGSVSKLDWNLDSSKSPFTGSIGIPVKTDPSGTPTVAALARNTSLITIASTEVQPRDYDPHTLDDATYKAVALTASTYSITKTKDGVDTLVKALDTSDNTFKTVLTEAVTYVFDGISLNMSVTSASIDGIEFVTKPALFSPPTNNVSETGLISRVLAVPRKGDSTTSDKYRVRVHKSDTEGLGTYVITSASNGITSAEITTDLKVSKTLFAGLSFRLANTTLETTIGSNLVLNSSFIDGAPSNPINWNLGSGATIDLTQTDTPHGSRALKLGNTTAQTGATGNLFKFTEITSPQAIVLSAMVKTEAGTFSGGLTGKITWYKIDNTQAGITTITLDDNATTSWTRLTLVMSSSNIPVGAVRGAINFYNTDPAMAIWINAIQVEATAVSAYRESDITVLRTGEYQVPSSPSLILEKKEKAPYFSSIDALIDVSIVSSQSTIADDWFIRVASTTTYDVIKGSTGVATRCATGMSYNGTVIPGVLLQAKNNFSATDVNDVLQVTTQAKFNATRTIAPANYYVSYRYNRSSAEYYRVQTYFRDIEVYDDWGLPNPANSVSLAASLFFTNGGTMLRTVVMDDANDWDRAYSELEKTTTNYVLPLVTLDTISDGDGSSIPTRQQYVNAIQVGLSGLQHCKKMSSLLQRKERTIWTSNLRFRDVDGMIIDAKNLSHKRAVYIGTTTVSKEFTNTSSLDKSTIDLDGCYLAAAALGLRLSQPDIATSLTRKSVVGFKSIGSDLYLSEPEKDLLGGNGVFLIGPPEPELTVFQVRHAVSTDTSNAIKREQYITDLADYLAKTTRDSLDKLFVGRKLLDSAPGDIQQAVKEILDAALNSRLITSVKNIAVTKSKLEPSTVNVRFEVSPVFPINWIKINFSLTR